jgi:hypothetical protein
MFESIAIGRLVGERENERCSGPVGDEHAMVIQCPTTASGILGAIVGHLNNFSPWTADDDYDYWDSAWHKADHAMDHQSYFTDRMPLYQWNPRAEGLASVGALRERRDYWKYGAGDDTLSYSPSISMDDPWNREEAASAYDVRPVGALVGDTDFNFNSYLDLPQYNMCEAASEAWPGLYCCSPETGYDLWTGCYSREPSFWGKFALAPRYGDAGPMQWGAGGVGEVQTFQSEYQKKLAKRQEKALKIAAKFGKRVAGKGMADSVDVEAATVTINGPLTATVRSELSELAKNLAGGEGIYYTAAVVSDSQIVYTFTAEPTTAGVGYNAAGIAAMSVLVGVLTGEIEGGEVVPMGDGCFGIVAPNVGNIFEKLKGTFSKDNPEKVKKQLEKTWAKLQKLRAKFKELSDGEDYTPWKAEAEAKATGFYTGAMVSGRGGRGGLASRLKALKAQRQSRRQAGLEVQDRPGMQALVQRLKDEKEERELAEKLQRRGLSAVPLPGRAFGGQGRGGGGGRRRQQQQPQPYPQPQPYGYPMPQPQMPQYPMPPQPPMSYAGPMPSFGAPPPSMFAPGGYRSYGTNASIGGFWSDGDSAWLEKSPRKWDATPRVKRIPPAWTQGPDEFWRK